MCVDAPRIRRIREMVKNTEDVELQRVGEYLESRRRIQNHGRRLKAYHESGHAVMANHFGLDVLYISLIPNDESAARCKRRHIDTTLLNPEDLRTLARLEMLILYAGHAAQSLMERHGKPHSSKYIADHWGSSDDFSAGMWARQIVGDVEDNATRAEAQAYEKANRAFRDWMVATAWVLSTGNRPAHRPRSIGISRCAKPGTVSTRRPKRGCSVSSQFC